MSRLSLIKRLDATFSIFIRRRDEGKGCISCGRPIAFNTSDAGHYITRGNMATRFSEQNVNAQCIECNRFKDGNIPGYERGLIRKYGAGVLEALNIEKNGCSKLSSSEIADLIKQYK